MIHGIAFLYRDGSKVGTTLEGPIVKTIHRGGEFDAYKAGAIFEGIRTDGRHTSRNLNARNISTILEDTTADNRQLASPAKGYRSEASATPKGITADARHRGRNLNARETGAAREGIRADARHRSRNLNTRKAGAAGEGTIRNR